MGYYRRLLSAVNPNETAARMNAYVEGSGTGSEDWKLPP